MRYRQKILAFFAVMCFVAAALAFASCEGGTCAATDSPLIDADSDCLPDSSDNCPLIYNPEQFDGDEDGVGVDCDTDDTDDTVAAISADGDAEFALLGQEVTPFQVADYVMPGTTTPSSGQFDSTCSYYVIGCGDVFLGFLDVACPVLQKNLLRPASLFARSFAACSALNPNASFPPALFCLKPAATPKFAGYLTINSQIDAALDTCSTLQLLDIQSEICAEF